MSNSFSRRDFVLGLAAGATATVLPQLISEIQKKDPPANTGGSVFHTDRAARITTPSYIAVDHHRCTGCGICEAECVLFHEKTFNLDLSRIRIHRFEPAIAVASVCTSCTDVPCMKACPPEASAFSRDKMTGAVLVDEKKCIGCRACVDACEKDRSGVVRMNPDTAKAVGICDLCGGDPACVKRCPESCLTIVPYHQDGRVFAKKPAAIYESLLLVTYRSGGGVR